MQGGSTLHTNMFSMVKTAFEVAVIRLVKLAAQIAAYGNEGEAADPTGEPPQKIIGGNQDGENGEGSDDVGDLRPLRQRIDEEFHPVLRRHRATDGADDGDEDRKMREPAALQVAANEGERPVGVFAQLVHQARTVRQGL
jgi:hypothetical protein